MAPEKSVSAREEMLGRIRQALGTRPPRPPAPEFPLDPVTVISPEERVARFREALTALGGAVVEVATPDDARAYLAPRLEGHRVIASEAPLVKACGFAGGFSREACADAEVGITSADFALADTGTLVFWSEPRLVSLLPPRHIAIIERAKIISGLDELFQRVPQPAENASFLVLVTGPSRTADIEMRLVRGVHGPGDILVLIVGTVTPSTRNASGGT
jgi:L-lactate dehydrogenase complex protein LldG